MNITLEDATRIANKLGTTVPPHRLLVGMRIEMEHAKDPRLNVVEHDKLETVAKIALAHFKENPGSVGFGDYYHHLEKMEKQSDKYWERHVKPNIFAYDLAKITF
jgi:uncharacterized protein with von Willebrand factor type A (vWA) domain